MSGDHSDTDTPDDESSLAELTKRQFIGATVGIGLLGGSGSDTGRYGKDGRSQPHHGPSSTGGGFGGGPGDYNGGGGDFPTRRTQVTLITGHTIVIIERESSPTEAGSEHSSDDTSTERTYAVEEDTKDQFRVIEESDGTYIVPEGADLDALDRLFFNIDYLVDQGYDDKTRDRIPVLARTGEATGGSVTFGGVTRTFDPTDVIATTVAKDGHTAVQAVIGTDKFERLYLDRRVTATLDASAPRISANEGRQKFDVDGTGIRIAVIDTGIDASHTDFGDRVVYAEDFTGEGTADEYGHGTHVAGIAAGDGSANDGEYVGVAPGASLMDLKALDSGGGGYLSDIVDAIEAAVREGADVINMSLGGPPQEDDPMVEAVDWAFDRGVTVVSSAGNEIDTAEFRSVSSPAVAAGAIAVGASDDDEHESFASARGPAPHTSVLKPEVVAPGTGITAAGSSDAGDSPYTEMSGTSMSAPHVSGLAALVQEQHDDPTPSGVEDCLVVTGQVNHDRDIYKRGGGVVDAAAALESPLRIHDAIVDLGTLSGATSATGEISIENVSDTERTVAVEGVLFEETEGTDVSNRLSVDPQDVSIAAGDTQSINLTVDVEELLGLHAGDITITSDGRTFSAVIGFTRALEVVVQKDVHGRRESAAGDFGAIWAHDGAFSIAEYAAFDDDGKWEVELFTPTERVSVWSESILPADSARNQQFGEPVLTVASGVDLTAGDSPINLDETSTVARSIDTSAITDKPTYEAFNDVTFSAGLYATQADTEFNYSRLLFGNFNVFTAHFTPITADESTNADTEWQFHPTHDRSHTWDVENAYFLFEPTKSISDGGETIAVDPDSLAREEIQYHRDFSDQSLRIANHVVPADQDAFPTSSSIALIEGLGPTRDRQTWWRTVARAAYCESWRDSRGVSGAWRARRLGEFVPPNPGQFGFNFNRQPLGQIVSKTFGTVFSPSLVYQNTALADQPPGQVGFERLSETSGGFQLRLNDEVIHENDEVGPAPIVHVDPETAPALSELSDGDTLAIRHDGWDHTREPAIGVNAEYTADYDPQGENRTPLVQAGVIAGQTGHTFRSGPTIVWLKLTPAREPDRQVGTSGETTQALTQIDAYYADGGIESGGSVAGQDGPLGDPWGGGDWASADIVYHDEERHLVGVYAEGFDSQFHLAIGARNDTGGQLREVILNAAGLESWADKTVSADVETNQIDLTGDETVTVAVDPFDGAEEVDWLAENKTDSEGSKVQFGAPDAVFSGEAADATNVEFRSDGTIAFDFPAAETGYQAEYSPVAAFLELTPPGEDRYAGVDALERVIA